MGGQFTQKMEEKHFIQSLSFTVDAVTLAQAATQYGYTEEVIRCLNNFEDDTISILLK
jgi:hypothetical protein